MQVVIAAGHEVPSHTLISLCQSQDHKLGSLDDDAEYSSAGVFLKHIHLTVAMSTQPLL